MVVFVPLRSADSVPGGDVAVAVADVDAAATAAEFGMVLFAGGLL